MRQEESRPSASITSGGAAGVGDAPCMCYNNSALGAHESGGAASLILVLRDSALSALGRPGSAGAAGLAAFSIYNTSAAAILLLARLEADVPPRIWHM